MCGLPRKPPDAACGGTCLTREGGMLGVPLTLAGKGCASNIQNEIGKRSAVRWYRHASALSVFEPAIA